MIRCAECGEDAELRGRPLDDGRREITCERCGHSWARGTATRVATLSALVRSSGRTTSADCGPRWDDEPVAATLNRAAPALEATGPGGVPLSLVPRREPTWKAGDPVQRLAVSANRSIE